MAAKFDFASLSPGFKAEWPVTVKVPKDGGGFSDAEFKALFEQLPVSEIDKIVKEHPLDPIKLPERYFVGLGKGEALPDGMDFETFKAQALDNPRFRLGIEAAYALFNSGVARKN